MYIPRIRALGSASALIAMTITQACYSYAPVAGAALPVPGERVRVVLTPEGTTELARFLGPNVAVVEGGLSSTASDGALVVAVRFVQLMNGIKQPWTGEGVVSIPAQLRAEVQRRHLLRNQTIVASTALALALVGVAILALRAGGGGSNGGDTGTIPP